MPALPIAAALVLWAASLAVSMLEMRHQFSWELWWVPILLALLAPPLVWLGYVMGGATLRGLWVFVGLGVLLLLAMVGGFSIGAMTDRPGEIIALLLAIACGLSLPVTGWALYDVQHLQRR